MVACGIGFAETGWATVSGLSGVATGDGEGADAEIAAIPFNGKDAKADGGMGEDGGAPGMSAASGFGGTTDAEEAAERGAGAMGGSDALAGAADAAVIAASGGTAPAAGTAPGGLNPEGGLRGARPLGGRDEPATDCAAPGIGGKVGADDNGASEGLKGAGEPTLSVAAEGTPDVLAAGTGLGGNLSGGSLTGPPAGAGRGALGGVVSLTVRETIIRIPRRECQSLCSSESSFPKMD